MKQQPVSLPHHLAAIAAIACLAFVAYAPLLNLFFVFDDLPTLRRSSLSLGNVVWNPLLPMSNGFWRPLNMAIVMVVDAFFGKAPLPFHLLGVGIHAFNCALVFEVARRVWGFRFGEAFAAAAVVAVHVGGWLAVAQLGNFADLTLASGVLISVLAFGIGRAWLLGLGLVVGFLAKETFVVIPAILLLQGLASGGRLGEVVRRPAWLVAASAAFVYAVAMVALQVRASTTYVCDGRLGLNPFSCVRRLLDYGVSLAVPYIHVMEFPFEHVALPTAALWLLRAAVLGILVAAVWQVLRGVRFRLAGAMVLSAATVLLPIAPLNFPTESRFLYAAVPFFALGMVAVFRKFALPPRAKAAAIAGLLAFHLAGFYGSGTVRGLRQTGAAVEDLVGELRRESRTWKPGAAVVILGHPHVAEEPHNWIYRQLIFEVFLGPDRFQYLGDQEVSRADVVYRFEGGRLIAERRDVQKQ